MRGLSAHKENFEQALLQGLKDSFSLVGQESQVFKAAEYSLFSGGKRFRPMLCFAAGKAVGLEASRMEAWAVALEFVHTYSLIHDDLPCMDDDDFRRGNPTTHKQFDEPTALLAGDALLTEAFGVVQRGYSTDPQLALDLIGCLVPGIGGSGMILGQALDYVFRPEEAEAKDLMAIHLQKTGQLMSLCLEGAGRIAHLPSATVDTLKYIGLYLGFAFQLKDDILDGNQVEPQSYLRFYGVEGTERKLLSINQQMRSDLSALDLDSRDLESLIQYNETREK